MVPMPVVEIMEKKGVLWTSTLKFSVLLLMNEILHFWDV